MPKRATSGSFTKGDKRINRDGRPKNSTDLSALFRRIGSEVATKKNGEPITGPDGRPMTVLEAIARQWAQNPKQQGDFVDRAYGKVPQRQEHTGADGEAIEFVVKYANGRNKPTEST